MINIVKVLAQANIINSVKRWGVEGTEDKIKEHYANMPEAKKLMLKELKEMYHYGDTHT